MSRTDNTLPWQMREEDRPSLPWTRILNTESRVRPFKSRLRRSFWKRERQDARIALARQEQPEPSRTRNSMEWDLW